MIKRNRQFGLRQHLIHGNAKGVIQSEGHVGQADFQMAITDKGVNLQVLSRRDCLICEMQTNI